jgi:murein DD-endopeptidase MepM/ murein hydrolase activator NlpD
MKRSLIIFTAVLLFSVMSFADSGIAIDNIYQHHFKGRTGRWELISSQRELNGFLAKYSAAIEEVRELNDTTAPGNYIFIPYSDEYLAALDSGKEREQIVSDLNAFIWPINRADNVSSAFGLRNGRLHTGVDIPAARGTPIIAAMDGMVVMSAYCEGHGKSIVIEHRNNYYSRYSHNSVSLMKKGDYVKKGQVIGYVGSTGNSTGNHLHFEIRYKDIPLDPLDFLPENEKIDRVHLIKNWK